MAKFLNGPGVQAALTDLMKESRSELIIISPYLKILPQTKNYLSGVDSRGVPITFIYRSNSGITDDDWAYFKKLANLKLYSCDNLHTKCYLNEHGGIITSMNLHEHSQTHNWEMGIAFSKDDDAAIFSAVLDEIRIMEPQLRLQDFTKNAGDTKEKSPNSTTHATRQHLAYKPTEPPNKSKLLKFLDIVSGANAYCIRCGKGLKTFDLQKPYCDTCYASWARYKNPKYKEKFCHACGCDDPKHPTSFEKPCCKHCFTKLYKK
jgi:hypothetical protein